MGVPGFFMWLMKQYKNKKFVFAKGSKDKTHSVNNIDWFLIDMNCMIHPVCFKTLAEITNHLDNNALENRMYNKIIEYLESTIAHALPRKGIYIAIDGVAPVAKMKQQRLRRYKSINDYNLYKNLRKKYNKPEPLYWSNSCITPGTQFMKKLNNRIQEWSIEYAIKNKLEIIFSSSDIPGEGEHKLLQFIRTKSDLENLNLYYAIYGLDADLIFLALSTNLNGIYLMREGKIFTHDTVDGFNFVSIEIMKECIIDTMITNIDLINSINSINIDTNRLIVDFIFICYLMGNDFLPHLPSLNIYDGAISVLIKKYGETFIDTLDYIINKNKDDINTNIFYNYINRLASIEESSLKKIFTTKKFSHPCISEDPYDIEVHRIENMKFKVNDPIQLGSDSLINGRNRYYNYYYHTIDSENESFSKNMVSHYMLGLKWVTCYYFNKCPDWNWYYPYDHPPFLTDISKNIFNFNTMILPYNECTISPLEQLLIVLPRQLAFLLPENLKKIMLNLNSSASHLYPSSFELDMISKKKYWMCNPILPNLEINLIVLMYKKYNLLKQ